jgi:hypothetical protein
VFGQLFDTVTLFVAVLFFAGDEVEARPWKVQAVDGAARKQLRVVGRRVLASRTCGKDRQGQGVCVCVCVCVHSQVLQRVCE